MEYFKVMAHSLRVAGLDPAIVDSVSENNLRRVKYASFIALPLHLIFIVSLLTRLDLMSGNEYRWALGVIYSHSVMFVTMLVCGIVAILAHMEIVKKNRLVKNLYVFLFLAYLLFGVVVTMFSNLAAPNISVFTIVCVGVSAVFLINPVLSLACYTIASILFFSLLPLVLNNEVLFITFLGNGFSVAAIGFFISVVLWRFYVMNLEQKRLIELQNEELNEKIRINEYLASHDPLTGLLNRTHFMHLTDRELDRMKRTNNSPCLIVIDIDNFKYINDTHGHPTGDMILKDIADLITSNIRKTDIIARFGGEEFAILLPETSLMDGRRKAEKLRIIVEKYTCSEVGDLAKVTASFGVALLDTSDDNPFDSGYRKADSALYLAKSNGRNRVEIAS
ncbi:MAG: diguanylate cyclase [Firmicutes bacterium]|nr:diguanylate cyclase [Bacillota bacterium]